jgi:integrase
VYVDELTPQTRPIRWTDRTYVVPAPPPVRDDIRAAHVGGAVANLTTRSVDAAPARPSEYTVWDDEAKGFGLRVWPSGRKVFVFKYQFGGRAGRTQRVTLGDYGTLTVEEARREAVRLRGAVAAGRSPADERTAQKAAVGAARAAPTVADLAEQFLADRRAKQKPGTAAEYERFLTRDVLPTLGAVKVAALTRTQVAKLHLAMQERPYLANRALAVLSAMLGFAELHGLRPPHSNPCRGIAPYPERARERFLSDAEFAALGAALRCAEREGLPVPEKLKQRARGISAARRARLTGRTRAPYAKRAEATTLLPASPVAVAALRFLLLTGWREGEARALRWDQLNLERGLATLPDTKTGKSVRHVGAPVLTLLATLPRLAGNPHVFPGRKPGDHVRELKRTWEAVRHAAGLPDLRLHDLRHSHASVAVSGGLSLPVIGQLIGHKEVGTTQRYAHFAADPLRRAADDVSAQISAAMTNPRQPPSPARPRLLEPCPVRGVLHVDQQRRCVLRLGVCPLLLDEEHLSKRGVIRRDRAVQPHRLAELRYGVAPLVPVDVCHAALERGRRRRAIGLRERGADGRPGKPLIRRRHSARCHDRWHRSRPRGGCGTG